MTHMTITITCKYGAHIANRGTITRQITDEIYFAYKVELVVQINILNATCFIS